MLAYGIDIGGTKTSFYLLSFPSLKILKKEKIITKNFSFGEFKKLIEEKSKEADLLAFSTPGYIIKGSLYNSPNNPLIKGKRFLNFLNSLEKPFIIENDANCFTYAEATEGRGKQLKDGILAGWIFGTGIGGGVVLKRKGKAILLRGKTGEFGHQILPFPKEKELSKKSLKARQTLNNLNHLTLESIASGKTREELKESYKKFEEYIEHSISLGFYNVQRITGAKLHIVGGGYGKFLGKKYFKKIEKNVKELFKSSSLKDDFKIEMFKLGDDAGALGAVLLLKEEKLNKLYQ